MADTAWVGRLSPEALGAVSTCFFASWTIFALGDTVVAGLTALIAQAVGAHEDDEATVIATTGSVVAIALGVVVATLGWFGAGPLFRLLFDDPQVIRMGTEYLSIYSLLAPLFYLDLAAESVYRSCGDSRTPMNVLLVGSALNIGLDPLFIFGIGPFPEWGVRGAALATAFAQIVVVMIYAGLYFRGSFPLPIRFSQTMQTFRLVHVRQLVKIGLPSALIGTLFSVVYLAIARITGEFGASALAALGVVNRLESLNYLTAVAVGMGVSTLVGQNLGADQPDRAEQSAHRGAQLISVTTGLLTLAFFIWPEPIARLFTSDPSAVHEAAVFLRIVAVSQVLMGWELVYGQALTGAGDTLPPMYVAIVTSVVRVPLAWWLATQTSLGVAGIWWTISITSMMRGIWLTGWFRRGHWKKKAQFGKTPTPPPPLIAAEGPEG
ncbi:MAG: MATE family efflux transporter [Gemmatimonadota bacterium]|nr:MAG: MATE family efflux transporter [Gemmatimonadota bacterium]